MVDTILLEDRIKQSGKTKTFIAKQLGCTIQSLRLKIINKSDFTSTEIQRLCDELEINRLTDKEKIFFKK